MRVQIVRDGRVLRGKKHLFEALVAKEARTLKRIWRRMQREDSLLASFPDPASWEEDARKSLISAAFRFGTGSITVDDRELAACPPKKKKKKIS